MSTFSSRSEPPSYYTNTPTATETEIAATPPPTNNTNTDVEATDPRRRNCSKLSGRLLVANIILVAIAALVLLIYYAHRADQRYKAEVAECVKNGDICDTVAEDDDALLLWTASLGYKWW